MIPGLSTITAKIAGGLAVSAFLALGVVMWRADAISAQRDAYRDQLATCEARHAVTRQSVGTLEAVIADLNRQAEDRADAYEVAKRAAAAETERLREQARTSDARIARLRELAEQPGDGTCEAPDALLRELEGL